MENLLVILVVEDDQLIQSFVEETLTDGGFEIVIASSGENAVELLDASGGNMSGNDAGDWASKGVPNSIMLAKPFSPAQLVTAVSQLLNTAQPPA